MNTMRKTILLSIILSMGILGACDQKGNETKDMNQTTMTGEMDDDMMEAHMDHDDEVRLNDSTGKNELKIPDELKRDEGSEELVYTVKAEKGETECFDGTNTNTLGYNGTFLGPMIRFDKGETVKIRTVNELDEETTFHWHGLEVAGDVDGGPHSALEPGEEKMIEFKVGQEAST